MKKITQTKEVTSENKVSVVQFITVLDLQRYFGTIKCKVESPNDIKLITDRQLALDKEVQEYTKRVMDTQISEDSTHDEIIALRTAKANEVLQSPSSLNRKDLQFYTMDQFIYGIQDLKLSNQEITFLSFWLVKPEE